MKRILFIPSTVTGGCWYFRVYTPMKQLTLQAPEDFTVTINNGFKFTDVEKDEIGKNYDIVIFHQALYMGEIQDEVWKTIIYCKKEYGTRFVLDIDDYWDYGKNHPYNYVCQFNAFPYKMIMNFKLFDYVTTTTEYFKNIISEFFPKEKIYVFENAISINDKQFTTFKNPSDKIRLGITGGSSHTEDIKELLDFQKYLNDKQLEQIELILCGYDIQNYNKKYIIDENGKIVDEQEMELNENWWYKIDKHLESQAFNYRHIETKDIYKGEYGKIYEDIDVVLVPLLNTSFNKCKSELKFIEAGFTKTAIITSKTIPYSNFGTDESNCLFVKEHTPQSWAQTIKKIIRDRELLNKITQNNSDRIIAIRNLEEITEKRIDFFNKI